MLPKMTPVSVEETFEESLAVKDEKWKISPNLDCGLDALETVRRDSICRWALDEFEIAQGGKVQAQVLQRVGGLVHK